MGPKRKKGAAAPPEELRVVRRSVRVENMRGTAAAPPAPTPAPAPTLQRRLSTTRQPSGSEPRRPAIPAGQPRPADYDSRGRGPSRSSSVVSSHGSRRSSQGPTYAPSAIAPSDGPRRPRRDSSQSVASSHRRSIAPTVEEARGSSLSRASSAASSMASLSIASFDEFYDVSRQGTPQTVPRPRAPAPSTRPRTASPAAGPSNYRQRDYSRDPSQGPSTRPRNSGTDEGPYEDPFTNTVFQGESRRYAAQPTPSNPYAQRSQPRAPSRGPPSRRATPQANEQQPQGAFQPWPEPVLRDPRQGATGPAPQQPLPPSQRMQALPPMHLQPLAPEFYHPQPAPGPAQAPMSREIMDRIARTQQQPQRGPPGQQQLLPFPTLQAQEQHHERMAYDARYGQNPQQSLAPGWTQQDVNDDQRFRQDRRLTTRFNSPFENPSDDAAQDRGTRRQRKMSYKDWAAARRRGSRGTLSEREIRWMWFYFTGELAPKDNNYSTRPF